MDFENPFEKFSKETKPGAESEKGKIEPEVGSQNNLFSINKELITKDYEELKKQVEKEIPNYEKFLPDYKLVKEIPDVEQREKGMKYFNDKKVMEQVIHDDLIRILNGENLKITADIAVTRYSEEELKQKIKEELYQDENFMESIPSEFRNIVDDYIEMEAENLLTQLHGRGRVAIFDDRNMEIMYLPDKIADIGIHSHEETHGFLEKHTKKEIPRRNKDFVAVNEGLAFAVEEFYSGVKTDEALLYLGEVNPDDIKKAQNLARKMTSVIGTYSTKKFVVNVINEAYEKKVDAVELLEERVLNYRGNTDSRKR